MKSSRTGSRGFPLLLSLAVLCFGTGPLTAAPGEADARPVVIERVSVLPMTDGGTVLRDATVSIANGRIVAVGGPAPKGARRIDGRGKWLIPGLTDMHVHMESDSSLRPKALPTDGATVFFDTQDIMTPYVANGITQIFNLDAKPESVAQRNEIAKGAVVGPNIALAAVINGGKGQGRIANTPSDGRQAVRDAKAEGYAFIKPYSDLDRETFLAVVDEAAKQGLKTVGHIPTAFDGKLAEALVPAFGMVAHAEEFSKQSKDFTEADAVRFAALAKRSGTWVSPTLTVMRWIASQTRSLDEVRASPTLQYVHPLLQSRWLTANRYNRRGTPALADYFDRMTLFHRRLVRAFKAAGVPMVAGTDTLTSGVVAGFSLHDELGLLVDAGLTPKEALEAATRLPSQWLGAGNDRGTIEVGKRADLVLLDADPTVDIANTRRIAGVMLGGRWLPRAKLAAMLADLSRRHTANKGRYDWNAMTR